MQCDTVKLIRMEGLGGFWLLLDSEMKQCLRGKTVNRPISAKSCKLDTISQSSHAGVAFNDRLSATTPASLPR